MDYVNKDGFTTVEKNGEAVPGEGNGWLQTGLAYATGSIYVNPNQFPEMFARCRKSAENPLIWRSPYKVNPGDETQCDDYWGAALLNRAWAKEMLAYAEKNGWNFDISGQNRFKYWFGRFLSFAPYLKVCAGEKLSILQQVILAGTFIWDSFSLDHADGNMHAYCRYFVSANMSGIVGWAAKFWMQALLKKYGTKGAAWSAYFGPDHPLSKIL